MFGKASVARLGLFKRPDRKKLNGWGIVFLLHMFGMGVFLKKTSMQYTLYKTLDVW